MQVIHYSQKGCLGGVMFTIGGLMYASLDI